MLDDTQLEAKLKASPAPRVTPAGIDAVIVNRSFYGHGLLTICVLDLANGFTVTGESACASSENYNQAIGEKIAFDNARNKIWALEGYLLKERLCGPFSTVARDRDSDFHETVARIAHEVNRAWCAFQGDYSQEHWADAPDWQRQSAINGVTFHLANPGAGDSASHDSWMAEKIATGWIYGPNKDPSATPPTHHCIVPFDDLPREQQFKDQLFRTIVHAAA